MQFVERNWDKYFYFFFILFEQTVDGVCGNTSFNAIGIFFMKNFLSNIFTDSHFI